MTASPYDMPKTAANHAQLSPLSFLTRTVAVYPARIGLIHGARRYSWGELGQRCRRLASALAARGIGHGDTVAIMAPNVPALFEAHFAPAMVGAVLYDGRRPADLVPELMLREAKAELHGLS